MSISVFNRDTQVKKTLIRLNDELVPTIDAGANGAHGSLLIHTFPAPLIQVVNGIQVFEIGGLRAQTGGGVGINDDATLQIGVGTTQVDNTDGLLLTTETDLVATSTVTLVGGENDEKIVESADPALGTIIGDGTSSDYVQAWLNIAMLLTEHGDNDDAFFVSGFVELHWRPLNNG